MANDPFESGKEPQDLSSLVLRLSMARGLDEITALVRRGVRRLLGADGATFVLREGNQCHYVDEDAISPLWKGRRFPMGICISGWSMQHGRPAVIPDIYKDSRIPADVYRLTFVRSMVMVPVGRNDAPAAIGAYWSRLRKISDQDVALVTAIADAASVALLNVSLYGQLTAKAAEATAKAKEAERANAAKSLFLAAASHNLRQPFQAMRLYQEVLAMQLADPMAKATMTKLDQAMKAGEGLLADLLNMSVLDAGIVTPHTEDFAIDDLLMVVANEFAGRADAAGLRLRCVPSSAVVRSDPLLLRRILGNLLDNAVRFTKHGHILLGARRRGEAIRIEVWDTGIGIPEDKHEAIFDEFFQIGNDGRTAQNGLGLGLSIVAKTCRLLGHRVDVRSVPGKGSAFWITVPAGVEVADEAEDCLALRAV